MVAIDGVRVRAAASAPSFRREASLEELREQAALHLKAVLAQKDDPSLSAKHKAAREAKARDFAARVDSALITVRALNESRRPESEAGARFDHGCRGAVNNIGSDRARSRRPWSRSCAAPASYPNRSSPTRTTRTTRPLRPSSSAASRSSSRERAHEPQQGERDARARSVEETDEHARGAEPLPCAREPVRAHSVEKATSVALLGRDHPRRARPRRRAARVAQRRRSRFGTDRPTRHRTRRASRAVAMAARSSAFALSRNFSAPRLLLRCLPHRALPDRRRGDRRAGPSRPPSRRRRRRARPRSRLRRS